MRLSGCARPSFLFLASLLLLPLSQALHESDVGIVDWHKHLIGVPLAGTTATAPAFHHTNGTSILLTATGNNVLAALNPGDGSVGAYKVLFISRIVQDNMFIVYDGNSVETCV